MATTVKLSSDLINEARRYGEVYSRSVPKQIEYWSKIGKIAEENPDLPYSFIKDILLAIQEANDKQASPYHFD
ncbi:MAG: ParD-like family protein [Candidatus Paracaedibacteraceae bacterium]|nr:ParD-like family protein [Candidatus Paracaedibacteraceae bacterium]